MFTCLVNDKVCSYSYFKPLLSVSLPTGGSDKIKVPSKTQLWSWACIDLCVHTADLHLYMTFSGGCTCVTPGPSTWWRWQKVSIILFSVINSSSSSVAFSNSHRMIYQAERLFVEWEIQCLSRNWSEIFTVWSEISSTVKSVFQGFFVWSINCLLLTPLHPVCSFSSLVSAEYSCDHKIEVFIF